MSDNSWLNYPAVTPSTVSYTADALNRYTAVGAVTPSYDGITVTVLDCTPQVRHDNLGDRGGCHDVLSCLVLRERGFELKGRLIAER